MQIFLWWFKKDTSFVVSLDLRYTLLESSFQQAERRLSKGPSQGTVKFRKVPLTALLSSICRGASGHGAACPGCSCPLCPRPRRLRPRRCPRCRPCAGPAAPPPARCPAAPPARCLPGAPTRYIRNIWQNLKIFDSIKKYLTIFENIWQHLKNIWQQYFSTFLQTCKDTWQNSKIW